ncbi:MAG: response regulator, partial [Cytophagaceae bacterium]|nr:response regulator [Cytophagaceae bacterium]
MINILLAEEQKIVREGIKSLIKDESEISVVAEAKNGKEVIEKIFDTNITLTILDLHLPLKDGIETTRYIKEKRK